jgi:hypothetical protein
MTEPYIFQTEQVDRLHSQGTRCCIADSDSLVNVQARKAALCVHSILRGRAGVAPGPEDELYSTFAEASELCQGVRNPLEDWSHQMARVTLHSAADASMGVPVFSGLEVEN